MAFVAETVEKPRASDSAFDAIRPLFNDRQIVEIMHISAHLHHLAVEVQAVNDLRSAKALAELRE
jgi:hypothetical protein